MQKAHSILLFVEKKGERQKERGREDPKLRPNVFSEIPKQVAFDGAKVIELVAVRRKDGWRENVPKLTSCVRDRLRVPDNSCEREFWMYVFQS